MLKSFLLLAAAASSGLAAVVRENWSVGWVNASPDGFSRPVIGINGQWPCPMLEANVGDKVVVQVHNNLGNQSTSIHWHGIMHHDTPQMDGAAHVTQCPIPPGESFTYEFLADKPGTYWYHAHVGAQYSDGLRAPFVIRDRRDPYRKDYDEEYILTLSDWYHNQTPTVLQELFSIANVLARPVLPSAGLINDAQRTHYKIQPGKRYKFRIVNMSAFAPAFLFFDGHKMSVVEIDAVSTRRSEADMLYVVPGQRYSVIVEAKTGVASEENFAINAVFDLQPDYRKPVPTLGFNINATAYLQYNAAKPDPEPTLVGKFNAFDDLSLMPHENTPLLGAPDQRIKVDFRVGVDGSGIPRGFINNVTYVVQKTPTLYTALSVGADAENPAVYGQVNPYVIKRGQIIEIELNNLTPGHHPFHLHGHHFQVVSHRAAAPSNSTFRASPMLRDGIDVLSLGSATIRFRADNPGVWLLHCHIEWHMPMGMALTIVEDPLGLQKLVPRLPRDHLAVCKKGCWPTTGNAAGNTEDHFNLAGVTDAAYIPLTGAMYTQGNCAAGSGNGTDGTSGNGNGNGGADGSDGSGRPDGGVSGQGVGSEGSGGLSGCPSGCTCSGPVIIEPPKKSNGGCDKDGVHIKYVTEAYYVTSTSTTTSTSTICAKPTPH